jgi:CheY-like chemotaxis protein
MLPRLEAAPTLPQLVLIVESSGPIRQVYRNFLVPRRYVVAEASDGIEALEKAIDDPPDFIVTADRLSHMDGLTLCRRLRDSRIIKRVPILVLTEEPTPLEPEWIGAGVDSVLKKPCLPADLLAEMQRVRERALRWRGQARRPGRCTGDRAPALRRVDRGGH